MVIKIEFNKEATIILLTLSGFLLAGMIFIGSLSDNIYTWNRDFEIKIMGTEYKFIWYVQSRPDYYEYHLKK